MLSKELFGNSDNLFNQFNPCDGVSAVFETASESVASFDGFDS